MNEGAEMPEFQSDAASPGVDPAVVELLPEFVQFASRVADAARRISLQYFRAGPELHIKADGSPVTVADRETERVIRDRLSRSYPHQQRARCPMHHQNCGGRRCTDIAAGWWHFTMWPNGGACPGCRCF